MPNRRVRIATVFRAIVVLLITACRDGSRQYSFRDVHLGMHLSQFTKQFPTVALTRLRLPNGSTVMLGRLPLEGFSGPSVVLGEKDGVQIVVQLSAEGGPAWSGVRNELVKLNGQPDGTWSSGGHEAAVWGADRTPQYDGSISPNASDLCSRRCLVATHFAGWTAVQLYDGQFLAALGPIR